MLAKSRTKHSPEIGYDKPAALLNNEEKQVETFMEPAYKILIADDHPLFREAISSVIASGFEGSEITLLIASRNNG